MRNSDHVMQGFYNNGWKKLEELELERERLSKLLIEARVKIVELEEDVKKYFDSCRLREESLFTEVERRGKIEARVKELEDQLHKVAGDISFWREQQNDSCKRVKELETEVANLKDSRDSWKKAYGG